MKNGNDLTPKQQAFVDNYLVSFNASDAARKAGYSTQTANRIAAENLTKPVIQAALSSRFNQIAEQREVTLINTHAENADSFRFTRRLNIAAEKYLEVNGEIELEPRGTEIQVIYTDPRDKTALKWPKQRKATLQELIDMFHGCESIKIESFNTRTIDIREYALKAVAETRATLAEIARIQGDYTKDKPNPTDIKALAEEIAASLIREGHPADQVQAEVSKLFPQLVSEAVN